MQRTGKVVKALIYLDEKALVLVKPNGDADLPGGRVEKGETTAEALVREIFEETGLSVSILGPMTEWSFIKSANLLITGTTYSCLYLGGKVILNDEHSEYFWADLREIVQLDWRRPFFGGGSHDDFIRTWAFHREPIHFGDLRA
jgi:8-oxo-dGTP diphosphatase